MAFGIRRNRKNKDTQSIGDEPLIRPRKPNSNDGRPGWAGLDLFNDLTVAEIAALDNAMETVEFKAGESIMIERDVGDDMYLLHHGKVRVEVSNERGGDPFSTILDAPTALGEMALVTSEPRSASVWAHSDVMCRRLGRVSFDKLVANHLDVARILTRLVGERLQEIGGIRKVGKYEIKGVLGKGNVAFVFEALHPELQQSVALKMLSHSLVYDPEFGAQFDREAQIVAALDHPHIVRVFDFERAYGTRFTVMERLEGEQLEDVIYRRDRLGWDHMRRILYELGSALHYSHERGLIHRDVKPSNVFITLADQAKLLDFGIAIHRDHSVCKNKGRLGSPCYMPPEQILGEALDERTDLYALGMTAYEMVVGEVPFNETDIRSLLRKQVYEQTPDVREHAKDCPEDIRQFVIRSTQKKPSDRFANCMEAVSSLDIRADSEPLIRARRAKLTIDYGPNAAPEVEAAIAELEAKLAKKEAISVRVALR